MRGEQSQQIAGSSERSEGPGPAKGILYVVGVPIGHPDDMTVRALALLRTVDCIASENPAATQRLLAHHRIHVPVTSYGPVNLNEKVSVLVQRLRNGARIALVSDNGCPVIADPGHLLITSARAHHIRVASVPGPSAPTAAISIAGLSGDSFCFQGPLPETTWALRRCLVRLLENRQHTVAFCTARSLRRTLQALTRLAPRRTVILACDLTTSHEKLLRGTARAVADMLAGQPEAGAITMVLVGRRTGRGSAR